MNNFDIVQILSLGVIGLGFLLAFMSYSLLLKEQHKENPRHLLLKSISSFMRFSLLLVAIGFASELSRLYLDSLNNKSELSLLNIQENSTSSLTTPPNSIAANYPLNYDFKITDDSIKSDSSKFRIAPDFVTLFKSQHLYVCLAAYSNEFKLAETVSFKWQLFDSAGNELDSNEFLYTPEDTKTTVYSCFDSFYEYQIGNYRFVVTVAGNSKEKWISLAE